MALKGTRKMSVEPEVASHWIRIILISHNVKSLEKVYADFTRAAKEKNLKVEGPVSSEAYQDSESPWEKLLLPKVLRRDPLQWGPQGFIDMHSPYETFKQITSISIYPGVKVKVSAADS